ncbi:hypothetical protein [Arthrobacter sp. UYEF36]|uniref:hypothetical protein n=1 Tax=Arthrobacter sp. UYEF36 TaxID=1756366 RepID=UPI0033991A56
MEPEQHSRAANNHASISELAATTPEEQRRIKFSALIGIGVAMFIMVPAVYRLATEPPRWADAIFASLGVGLIIFHAARVILQHRR